MNRIKQLNQQFSIEGRVNFSQGKGELPFITVNTSKAAAIISLHGGQVLSYQPVNTEHDLLFLSNSAYYQTGKAIKGGAPVCWPWFAAHPEDDTLPFHGLVRNQLWRVESSECRDDNTIVITLIFTDNEYTRQHWPYEFELREVITIGDKLGIELTTTNTGRDTFTITEAIHTYFNVGDINQVQVTGLENKTYLDKVERFKEKTQPGPISIDQEVDRIYQHVEKPLMIDDQAWQRCITITHSGSATTVVWNPWKEISRNSQDLEDDDYLHFICVETANAAKDIVKLAPGTSYMLSAWYTMDQN